MIDYSLILSINYAKKRWVLAGNTYEGLEWYDESTKPTKEELDSQWNKVESDAKKNNCKEESKKRIASCDWSVLPDVKIQNKAQFENYRSTLRNLILNPIEDPIFPIEPTPIWIIQPDITGDNNG